MIREIDFAEKADMRFVASIAALRGGSKIDLIAWIMML